MFWESKIRIYVDVQARAFFTQTCSELPTGLFERIELVQGKARFPD